MQTFTPPDVLLRLHQDAPFIVHTIDTWSSNGDTTYGLDIKHFQDGSGLNLTTSSFQGMHLLQPALANAALRHRQIGAPSSSGNALDPSLGKVFVTRVYGTAPQSGDKYVVLSIPGLDYHQQMLKTAAEMPVPWLQPLSGFTNADFQTDNGTDISSWTVAAGSLTPSTSYLLDMAQSGFFNPSGSNDNIRSVAILGVEPGETYEVWATSQVVVGGPAILVLYDVSNAAEIDSAGRVSHSHSGPAVMYRQFTAPTGCRQVYVYLYATAGSDEIYAFHVQGPRKASQRSFDLPTWVKSSSDVRGVMLATYRDQISSGVYDATSREFGEPLADKLDYVVRTLPGASKARLELDPRISVSGHEVYIAGTRKLADLTTFLDTSAGETVVGYGDFDLFCDLLIKNIIEEVIFPVAPDDKAALRKYELLVGGNPAMGVAPLSARLALYANDLQPDPKQKREVSPMFRTGF